jgi:hypothetical protein
MNEILSFPPELLLKKHVAYLLSTSEWGVSQLVREKKLTPVEDGGKWVKFRLEDVREYIRRLPERNVGESM